MNLAQFLSLAIVAIPIILAITLHEAAHGFAARALGDDTAAREGRLTLNPFAHIDPVGTLLLPAVLFMTIGTAFGYAKPVPVNPSRLGQPRRDMALVAAAGPLTNIALAILSALLIAATTGSGDGNSLWRRTLEFSVVLNFLLAILNLYPLPPLDGSKVVAALLPPSLSRRYLELEPYGFPILILILFLIPFVSLQMGYFLNLTSYFLIGPAYNLSNGLLALLGAK